MKYHELLDYLKKMTDLELEKEVLVYDVVFEESYPLDINESYSVPLVL